MKANHLQALCVLITIYVSQKVGSRATAFSSTYSGSVFTASFQRQEQIIALHSSPWDSHEQTSRDAAAPSVGDYVQGVHGGKYQFEEAGGATFAGRQFAEALYSSDPNEGVLLEDPLNENEPLPSWVQKMGSSGSLGQLTPLQNFPVLSLSSASPTTSVSITNDERSWEHFYSKIVQVAADGTIVDEALIFCHEPQNGGGVKVTPAKGHLAPRGGSSNLCDPDKPYSDTATIQISVNAEGLIPNGESFPLLVIGTEAETWKYWLQPL